MILAISDNYGVFKQNCASVLYKEYNKINTVKHSKSVLNKLTVHSIWTSVQYYNYSE